MFMPIPLAARSKAWVCSRSLTRIVGSNPAGGLDVCLLRVLCVVRLRSLRRVGPSSWGVLPNVLCLKVWSWSLENWDDLSPEGAVKPLKKKWMLIEERKLCKSLLWNFSTLLLLYFLTFKYSPQEPVLKHPQSNILPWGWKRRFSNHIKKQINCSFIFSVQFATSFGDVYILNGSVVNAQ
jgi:hypothetical protein